MKFGHARRVLEGPAFLVKAVERTTALAGIGGDGARLLPPT